ncbi:hypothetical protein UFOVP996_41 [uncultured Caudovirales phage]|uniref:Uncharacterized protein n=1 Tax=uncultured Caudovirales phage TaxID=2100421 RepID=A0A6J5Q094_9CAUD|nr:hypothetical protein UFOVP996_41 [uncultured Caudovirales phage]
MHGCRWVAVCVSGWLLCGCVRVAVAVWRCVLLAAVAGTVSHAAACACVAAVWLLRLCSCCRVCFKAFFRRFKGFLCCAAV